MSRESDTAIKPTRSENYPEWYQQVVKAADLAEVSPVRGCMIIKPWGYGIWENIQREFDKKIKETGHENAYFPLFIPLSFLEKEAAHVEGFAKECAVVTHHRLEEKNGKLVPTGELEEPLIVRPTSETIIADSFSKWIQSYRDLPLLINQWANVVRWEMRTRLFLRSSEFLWQEGHTAHATSEEALNETLKMLDVYRSVMEDVLGLGLFVGEKPEHERFPGAVNSYCCEAMVQDRKALQAGTSHFLGQNFSKAQDIKFVTENGNTEYVWTTSWGVSTRLIGAIIMTHSDDNGLRLPPRIAPKHVVILPVIPKPEMEKEVIAFAEIANQKLDNVLFANRQVVSFVDKRDLRGGEKNWQWIKKGIPIRIEVGPKDMALKQVVLYRRDKNAREKEIVSLDNLSTRIPLVLEEIQNNLFRSAVTFRDKYTESSISTFDDFKRYFTSKNEERPEIHGGFLKAGWSGEKETLALLEDLKVSIRCILMNQNIGSKKCVLSGKPAKYEVVFAKAY